MRPHRWQSTRLPCPWDSPGKNTGVGCHFLLQCMKVKRESEVTQSCPTLSDPMVCSPPGSSVLNSTSLVESLLQHCCFPHLPSQRCLFMNKGSSESSQESGPVQIVSGVCLPPMVLTMCRIILEFFLSETPLQANK